MIALVLILGYMFAEIIGGILAGSLALLADAGHMLTDAGVRCLGLGRHAPLRPSRLGEAHLRLLAPRDTSRFAECACVVADRRRRGVGGVRTFFEVPELQGGVMLTVGAIGLVVNVLAARILHSSAKDSVNVEGAFAHVLADLLGSVAVVVSAILVWAFGWHIADLILSVLIAFILCSTWRLLAKVVHVMLEGTPEHIDLRELCNALQAEQGVALIHDIHVWTLAPGSEPLTAHVLVDPDYEGELDPLLRRLRKIVGQDFGIGHITMQLDRSHDGCTEDHYVDYFLGCEVREPKLAASDS